MTKSKRWKSQLFTNIKTIALDDITADQSMQQRAKFHDEIISEYAETLRNDGQLAPVKVVRDQNGTLWLWDGFHTLEAAKQAGKATIKAEISRGTRRDAWEKSLSANETHGIRRSRADRQKAVDNALSDREIKISLLEEDAKYSFRSIAKLCNVGHQTVSRRWNDVHLPEISEEIDKAVRQEPLPGLMTNQEWFAQIAQDLSVPAWLVLDRYTKSRVALTLAEEKVDEFADATTHQTGNAESEDMSDKNLTSGPSPTHQTRSAPSEDVSDKNLTGGPSPTHQTRSAPREDVSDKNLTGGPSPTHQTRSAPSQDVSDKNLTGVTSDQTGNTPSAEIITTPVPANIIIHNPTVTPRYSGQDAGEILTSYMSEQVGVKVVEARRPDEGWTGQVGQEIGQALSVAVGDDIKDISSMLIVIVR